MKHTNKHIKNKIKKIILKTISYIMFFICGFSISCLDAEFYYIPLAAVVVSGGWLVLMAWANGYMD